MKKTALDEWRSALGDAHVSTHPEMLDAAATATFETTAQIPVILQPANTDEVRKVMEIANRYRFPIYPVSSGKNWGYGSRVPTTGGCALLDLSRMNRIVGFSEELAYVTVEPGVTQAQLFAFLKERSSKLWMDATGSSPQCSIIGNTVERGFGHTPYADHFANVCGIQTVLGNGEVVETGFSGYEGCHCGPLYKWGLGPSVDGLFSQSNLGIVTRMTVWLMPAPECFQAFFFRCDDEEMLSGVIDALRPLRLNGTLRSSIHIGNDYKVLSGIQTYPWDYTGGRTPLNQEDLAHFRKSLNFGWWNGSGALYGTKAQVREARRLLKRALKGKVDRLQFVDEFTLALAERFAGLYRLFTGWDLSRTIQLARPILGLMKGVPTAAPMESVYWRMKAGARTSLQANPDRDNCGLLWLAPILPLDGAHARRVAQLATQVLLSYGFEPMLSLALVTERAIACVISISYDRTLSGQDRAGAEAHETLLRLLVTEGYPPYRLGVQSMEKVGFPQSLSQIVSNLRHTTDPNHILAPGRYDSRLSIAVSRAEITDFAELS